MFRKLALGFLILLFYPNFSPAQTCSHDAIQRAVDNVKSIQTRMLAVKGDDDGMNYEIAPGAGELIRLIKDALAAAIDEYMRCVPAIVVDTKEIEATLANLLQANKPKLPFQPMSNETPAATNNIYGAGLKISLTRPDVPVNLIAAKASFDIGCGYDTILLMYEWRDGIWQQELRWQSGNYNDVSGAFGDFFEFVVLPRKTAGDWLVAVAHGKPWCTSRWSGFDINLLRPARGGMSQQMLFHKHNGYVRETDPVMKAQPGGFELRVETGHIDDDIMTRTGIYHYRLAGDTLRRDQPIALNGRDFVDEWLQVDWSDAVRWSAATNASNLQNVHRGISKLRDPNAKELPGLRYGAVRACTSEAKHFQVELDRDSGDPIFFQIEQGANSFTMLNATAAPDPRCKSADLMQKH